MPPTDDLRKAPDRRRHSRGGRRPGDIDGVAPLIMVVGQDGSVMRLAEAVLARLKFAVSPAASPEDALRVIPTLRPDIVVAAPEDTARLRQGAPEGLSIVPMTDAMREDPALLIEGIREAMRADLARAAADRASGSA